MSEIRDKVTEEIQGILLRYMSAIHAELIHSHDDVFLTEKILSIPELAIVDREAELPKELIHLFELVVLVNHACIFYYITPEEAGLHLAEIAKDMLKAGWVKEVKDDLR